jgi:hypothetical protein
LESPDSAPVSPKERCGRPLAFEESPEKYDLRKVPPNHEPQEEYRASQRHMENAVERLVEEIEAAADGVCVDCVRFGDEYTRGCGCCCSDG